MSKSRIVQPDRRWSLLAVLLLAFTALLYFPVTSFPFLQVDDNPRLLQQDLSQTGLIWAFSNSFVWQPLTWMSHQLDFRMFGFQNAGRHHVVSLLLHLANTGLFFWLLVNLTKEKAMSLIAAALFALHPLRVESVAWVSGRGDLLATFFVLLALEAHRRNRWWAAVLLGALATLASPAAAPIALLILLLDRFILDRAIDWREIAPLAVCGVSALAFRALGGPDHDTLLATPPVASLLQGLTSFQRQLMATFFPLDLSIARMQAVNWTGAAAGAFMVAAVVGIFWSPISPAVRTGIAWFVLTMLPSMFLPSVWGTADHTSYLPHLGLMMALVFTIPIAHRALSGKIAVVLLAGFAALSWAQIHRFAGTVPLLQHAVNVEPRNAESHLGLAMALAGQGSPVEAEKHFAIVTKARPDSALAWVGHSRTLTSQKRPAPALAVLDQAMTHVSNSAEVRFERGIALQNMGRVDEAERSFIEALNLGLDSHLGAVAYNNLGSYAAQRKELPKAEKYFEQAFTLDLGFAMAHRNYAMTLVAQGQRGKAINHLQRKATLWTKDSPIVGEYLSALMNESYAEEYKKQQQQMAIEQEAERKASEKRK